MPMSLPDTVLLRLARDFRCVEAGSDIDDSGEEDSPAFTAALYVVMSLLLHHPGRTGDKNDLQISDQGLMRAFQIYQVGLEREIVTRITGLSSSIPPDTLAEELLRCTDERNG